MSFLNDTLPQYTCDPAETILAQVLHHIHAACIQEFLYPPQETHLQQLQQLQRILLQPRRQALNMTVKSVTESEAPPVNEALSCVIFPSFTIGPLSVMYHIAEHVRSNVSPCNTPYISRSVRDDQRGIYAVFAEMDNGCTEIDIIVLHSPAVREHINLVVKTDPFRVVMDNLAKGRVYDERMIRNALIFTARMHQIRQCPSCGRRSVACACSLNLIPKRYPVDFTTDLANLASYTGDYEGLCYQAIYEDGVNLCTWVSELRAMGRFSCNNDGVRKLESWAMWNTLQGRENLCKMVMPDIDAQPTEYVSNADHDQDDDLDWTTDGGDTLSRGFFSHDIGAPSGVQIPQYMAHNVPSDELAVLGSSSVPTMPQYYSVPSPATTTSMFYGMHAYDQSTTYRDPSISSLGHVSAGEVNDRTQSAVSAAEVHGRTPSIVSAAEVHGRTPSIVSAAEVHGRTPSIVSAAEVHDRTRSIDRTVECEVPYLPRGVIGSTTHPVQQPLLANVEGQTGIAMDKDATVKRKPKRMGRPPAQTVRSVKPLVPIVPAVKAIDTGCEEEEKKYCPDETSRKSELRKAQNRESAQRSHERKLKRVQALEDDLEVAKRRAAMLRQEVQELKEENLVLRAKLEDNDEDNDEDYDEVSG